MLRYGLALATVIGLSTPCVAQVTDLDHTLERVATLVQHHRFQEVIDTLTPLEGKSENRETQYIIAAELGRAHFHLGQYHEAHQYLRSAVAIHPERVESALYLESTAYLLGDREQALAILEAVLSSGARDLYLAVTLPGESAFLSDPEVWRLIDEYTIPIELDLVNGSVGQVELGMTRVEVEEVLEAPAGPGSNRALTARTGPHVIWSYTFSEAGNLDGVVLHNETLVRYTPFRVQIGHLDWRVTPAAVTSLLGVPTNTTTDEHRNLTMSWQLPTLTVTMVFGHPRPPRPFGVTENVAMLKVVRIKRN